MYADAARSPHGDSNSVVFFLLGMMCRCSPLPSRGQQQSKKLVSTLTMEDAARSPHGDSNSVVLQMSSNESMQPAPLTGTAT